DSRIFVLFDAVAVVDLNLIPAHEIDARVGMFRDAKLDVRFDITELLFRDQIFGLPGQAIEEDARARRDGKTLDIGRIQGNRLHGQAFACGLAPAGQVVTIEQKVGLLGAGGSTADHAEGDYGEKDLFHTSTLT